MKKQYSKIVGALIAAFAANVAFATPAPPPATVPCTLDSYTITKAAPAGMNPVPIGPTFNATKCLGVVNGVSGGTNPANVQVNDGNLGYLGDGLLNGENNLVPWNTFITADQLLDLNPNTTGAIDPGWIQLGTMNGSTSAMSYSSIGSGSTALNMSSILSFTQTKDANTGAIISGTWTLKLDANIINILHANGLFQRNNFDQLAFVVKASDKWAVYDFNFARDPYLSGFDLTQPYSLGGTWNLDDFKNSNGQDQALSFLSVWARDPISGPAVPEPGVLGLLGVGLLAMTGLRRRQAK
ncbi:hypothetical protein GCM10027277_53750 [Pseudoduganella ginsengisoli]|uniref:PEP-CTERM sorting domain-containing protein n=1 Tax=Pseudoduganella ginsengisoli TaxID=1462440 RepID=A0A6L6Q1R2_9BURK|nr:PEP-CTERM sorting domain-containing protein [Pseudoduganella ginsengisoli]MTW03369.1 PEP-CTERM sorting domain-containing protein [Pseudoduganella ginsengisoli]